MPMPMPPCSLLCTSVFAVQVSDHLQEIGRPAGIWVAPIVGGISAQKQERLMAKRPEVGG
jgi:ATP-dependent RNA helicase DDX24/MAK5